MKEQSTFYPNFISKTVDLLRISSCITKNAQIIDIWCSYGVHLREKMSQITHFCGIKFLAWKSTSVKFLTNIMSVMLLMLMVLFAWCWWGMYWLSREAVKCYFAERYWLQRSIWRLLLQARTPILSHPILPSNSDLFCFGLTNIFFQFLT